MAGNERWFDDIGEGDGGGRSCAAWRGLRISAFSYIRDSWFVSEECLAFEVLLKTKTMGLKEEFMLPVEEVLRLREGSRKTFLLGLG
ncbi:hypothetical protein RAB80_014446 [Fusarium oxysporum f. sp. vasinfectum]|nr:hypothetical protein RAB80_014446 [Fusarium oxysporum f. sp. vasinfectum]